MKELVEKINAAWAVFAENADKQLAGNKAAGARARKASLEIEKALKEFRKVSVEAGKKLDSNQILRWTFLAGWPIFFCF